MHFRTFILEAGLALALTVQQEKARQGCGGSQRAQGLELASFLHVTLQYSWCLIAPCYFLPRLMSRFLFENPGLT